MSKKEKNNIEKGKKIGDITLRIMRKESKATEDLKSLLTDNSYENEYLEKMSNPLYLQEASQNYFSPKKEEMTQRLLQRIKTGERRKRIRRISIATASVAACLALLTFITYYNAPQKSELVRENTGHFLPVKVPTLITDSGDKFFLNETIEVEQLDIEAKESNRLSYKQSQETTTEGSFHTLLIPRECRYTVVLSDSTEVTLNAGSRLRYPNHFTGEARKVELEGEAYFKVAKTGKPFIVSTKKIDIKVYGTEFNVNLNKKASIETILIHGSVGITIKDSDHDAEIMMTPNQLFSFNSKTDRYNLQCVDCDLFLGWQNDSFTSSDQEFHHIIEAISTWYGVSFTYNSDEIRTMKISANIDMRLTLKQVIDILEGTTEKTIINEGNNRYMIR